MIESYNLPSYYICWFSFPGFERLLPPGANPLESHWLEIQRRYGHPLVPGAAGGSHLPGIYPPTSIASDLMARERDRLERLGRFWIFLLK